MASIFASANAVLARNGAAKAHTRLGDFKRRRMHLFDLSLIPRVEQKQRMEIAIARVENVSAFEPVLLGKRVDLT